MSLSENFLYLFRVNSCLNHLLYTMKDHKGHSNWSINQILPMKSRLGIQIILIMLVLAIGGFDKHLAAYCPGDSASLLTADCIPSHSDIPAKSFDYHEDIAIRTFFFTIPDPAENSVNTYSVFLFSIPRISSHSVWQPPELSAWYFCWQNNCHPGILSFFPWVCQLVHFASAGIN